MPIEVALVYGYFLVCGLITDALVSRRAQADKRGYHVGHFLLAFATGWLIVPLGFGAGVFFAIMGKARGG